MQQPTKQIRKLIREYGSIAHERELSHALEDLRTEFDRWQNGEISAFDLSDAIHEFHDGTARDLWVRYNWGGRELALANAIALGFFSKDELPSELLASLSQLIDYFETDQHAANE